MLEIPLWYRLRAGRTSPLSPRQLLNALHIEEPPIDVFALTEKLGVTLLRTPLDVAGYCVSQGQPHPTAVIGVNAEDSLQRQRFTCAHELGHLFLHDLGVMYRDRNMAGTEPREASANGFAARLLMPNHMVLTALRIGLSLADMALAFDVSVTAMRVRVDNVAGKIRK